MAKPQVAQVSDMDPADREFTEQVTLITQAVLADQKHAENVVKLASSGPDGIARAVMIILSLVNEKEQVAAEDAPVAAFSIVLVLLDFLAKIKRANADAETLRAAMVATMDAVAQQYGASDEDIAELDNLMPGLSQEILARRGQAQQPEGMMGTQPEMGQTNG